MCDDGQPVGGVGVGERIPITFEEREVGVHPRARKVGPRLGHERRMYVMVLCHHPDDMSKRHDGVGHAQRIVVTQVDLLLRIRHLVVGVLDRNRHRFERQDRVAAEV